MVATIPNSFGTSCVSGTRNRLSTIRIKFFFFVDLKNSVLFVQSYTHLKTNLFPYYLSKFIDLGNYEASNITFAGKEGFSIIITAYRHFQNRTCIRLPTKCIYLSDLLPFTVSLRRLYDFIFLNVLIYYSYWKKT